MTKNIGISVLKWVAFLGLVVLVLLYPVKVGLPVTYALVGLVLVSVILFPLYYMATNLSKAKGGLIGFAILLALMVFAVVVSPAQQGLLYEKFNISPFQSQLIGGALLTTYLLFAGIILSAVYTEVAKWLK